jgi:hypothetical protein
MTAPDPMRKIVRHIVMVTGVLGAMAYVCVYALRLAEAPIRSDGFSYYVYLPSWLIYGDPTLAAVADDCCGGTFPEFTAIARRQETGRWVNPHPIGVAIQLLPFFVAANALSWWSNLPRDGFSLYYQHFTGIAGLAYFLAGLSALRRLLSHHFSDAIVLATLATITWGTNLFHYAVFDSTFSHIYSFFLVSVLLLLTDRWWDFPTWRLSLALSVVAALIVLTRHPNAIFLLVVPLYGVTRWADLARNARRLWDRRALVAGMIAVTAAGIVPQVLIYKRATGHWFVNSYGTVGFDFRSPHLFDALFSVRKGLFFWSPVLALSVIGLFVARGWARGLVAAGAIVMTLDTFLIASWSFWEFGGSYGHRGFTDSLGLLAIFVAACFAWIAARPRLVPVAAALTALAVALSVAQMIQYWLGIIPVDNTTWDQYRGIFLRFR